jgi:hypothetical protein
MSTYIRVDKYGENEELLSSTIEPFNIEYVKVALEEKLIDEGEVGESILLTIIEMSDEEYRLYERENGY